jgi:hypothetical protein
MKQRGRKGTSHLVAATAPIQDIPRAAPPASLTDHQAATWVSVVNTKPADWFGADTLPLLAAYCKHVEIADRLDRQIESFDDKWLADDAGVVRFQKLTDMREKHSRQITALARSMRLTQQAQINPKPAGTASRKAGGGKKPWEA